VTDSSQPDHEECAAPSVGVSGPTEEGTSVHLDDALRDDAAALQPDLADLRHRLHRVPEVGLQLPRTQELVLAELDGLGLEVSLGRELTSVTAVLRGGRPGPAVLLRGDMDALPVQEQTGLPWASEHDGAMHACGHDLHTAMLVGAARVLAGRREELAGDVVLMFQPGEEGFDGAGRMLDEGVLDAAGRRVSSAYGMHVMSARIPRAAFTTRPGTLMAASDGLRVTVRGEGGHGSAPHLAKDPVTAAAEMVTALQTLVTRRFDVFDPVVVTVGSFHAGTKRNIIPDEALFEATVRSFSTAARDRIRAESVRLCQDLAAAHGLEVDAVYSDEYPATVNDAEHTAFAAGVVAEVFGEDRLPGMPFPQAGAEDFSRVLQAVPGCYLFLGACTGADPDTAPNNHSPRATFDDSVLSDGVLLHAQLAVRALQRDASESTEPRSATADA
jgi:amidohydrolase